MIDSKEQLHKTIRDALGKYQKQPRARTYQKLAIAVLALGTLAALLAVLLFR